jgi:hypothetical protein
VWSGESSPIHPYPIGQPWIPQAPAPPDPLLPPAQPLRTCCRHRYATGQTPWYHWMSRAPLDTASPRPRLEPPEGPPGGGVRPPQGMRNPFTFLGQNSHPRPPQPPFHDAHLVNRGTHRLLKGVYGVSGCWSLGTGVSRPKPIGDYGYLWILILIHIRHNP